MGLLREAMELGLGVLVLTKEAAEEALGGPLDLRQADGDQVDDLRERGRRLADELTAAVRDEVDAAMARAGLARREELDSLAARVAALEGRLSRLELAQGGVEPAADL